MQVSMQILRLIICEKSNELCNSCAYFLLKSHSIALFKAQTPDVVNAVWILIDNWDYLI